MGRVRVTLTESERAARAAEKDLEQRRRSMPIAEYLAWCRSECRRGLRFNAVRAKAWRDILLLGDAVAGASPTGSAATAASVSSHVGASVVPYRDLSQPPPPHCHAHVVDCDIQRSLWQLYPDEATRERRRAELREVLLRVLADETSSGGAHYYQGLHELTGFVLSVISPVLERETCVAVISRLVRTLWAPFCRETTREAQVMLSATFRVLAAEDSELGAVLESVGLGPDAHFALPWLITWFVHNTESTDALARVFDFLIGSSPDDSAVVCVAAALVLTERERVLSCVREEMAAEETADPMVVYGRAFAVIGALPRQLLRVDGDGLEPLLQRAAALSSRYGAVIARCRGDATGAVASSRDSLSGRGGRRWPVAGLRAANAVVMVLVMVTAHWIADFQ